MPEILTEAIGYIVSYHCDDDDTPLVSGDILPTNPPLIVHQCPTCNRVYHFRDRFPVVRYAPKPAANAAKTKPAKKAPANKPAPRARKSK